MHPISNYVSINAGYPYGLRGTKQQTDTGLLWKNPPYSPGSHRTAGMALGYFSLHNRSAATVNVGIGVRIPNYLWKYYTRVDSTTTSTDVTTNAQGTSTAVDLNSTTNNDGHVILSRVPFNAISYNITQAVTGSPVNAIRYTNTAGTGWTNLTNPYALPASSAGTFPVTGEAVVAFNEPTDWGKTAAAGLETGLAGGYYGLAFRSTTAPSQKAQATGVEIFRLFFLTEGVADNGSLSQDFGAKDFVMALDAFSNEGLYGDALVAAFLDPAAASQGVKADIGNRVSALIRSV
jgi:hypothetical protein